MFAYFFIQISDSNSTQISDFANVSKWWLNSKFNCHENLIFESKLQSGQECDQLIRTSFIISLFLMSILAKEAKTYKLILDFFVLLSLFPSFCWMVDYYRVQIFFNSKGRFYFEERKFSVRKRVKLTIFWDHKKVWSKLQKVWLKLQEVRSNLENVWPN